MHFSFLQAAFVASWQFASSNAFLLKAPYVEVPLPDAAAIQRAKNVSIPLSMYNNCTDYKNLHWFPQVIDHATFNGNWAAPNSTFLQQYQVVDKYYRPDGPILFYPSEEVPMVCAELSSMLLLAQSLGALVVRFEHRYFGLSVPYGLEWADQANWPISAMKPLTLDNTLLDGIRLLRWLKTVGYPQTKDAKVIITAGSYGGTLVTLYRYWFPDDITGAVASSPVYDGLISDPLDPRAYGLGEWANMVYNDYSAEAAAKIKDGMTKLRTRLNSGNYAGLDKQLHLCGPINSTQRASNLPQGILAAYSTHAQYNSLTNGFPLYATINATLISNDSIDAIGASIAIYNAWNKQECYPIDPSYVKDPFLYMRCTFLPYPDEYSTNESIWGAAPPDPTKKLLGERCQKTWGIESIEGGDGFQRSLGLDRESLMNMKNLLITWGMEDPVTGLGVSANWQPSHDRSHSRIYYIPQAGHGFDLGLPNSTYDSDALTYTRTFEISTIKNWIGMT